MEQELIDYYKKIDLDYYILTAEEKNHIKQMIERLYSKRIVSGRSPNKTGILARDARHASILL